VGSGAGPAATAGRVEALGDGEGLELGVPELGVPVGALDVDASERTTAQVTRPQKTVCARGCPATGLWSTMNALVPPRTISPAAAQGAMYRPRQVSWECGRPLSGGSAVLDGSPAPLDDPVDIRSPPWTAKCYQIAMPFTAIMSGKQKLGCL